MRDALCHKFCSSPEWKDFLDTANQQKSSGLMASGFCLFGFFFADDALLLASLSCNLQLSLEMAAACVKRQR